MVFDLFFATRIGGRSRAGKACLLPCYTVLLLTVLTVSLALLCLPFVLWRAPAHKNDYNTSQ
jgi:hypothetical protein